MADIYRAYEHKPHLATSKQSISELYFVVGVGLFALLIRIIFSFVLFPYLSGPLNLDLDPDYFGRLAQNWADGKGYVFDEREGPTIGRGPGYPLLLAGIYLVFGQMFPAAVLAQCLIGSLVCVVMYYLGKQVFGSWVGYIAAFIGAVHPLLIWYSPRLRYEPLLTLLLALAILWSLKVQDSRSLKDAFLMGLFFGAAALISQIVILLPVALFVVFLWLTAHKSTLIKPFVVALLTMIIIIIPWTIRNYQVSGRIIPVHSGGVTQFVTGNYEFEHYHEAPLQSVKLGELGVVYAAQLLGYDDVAEFNQLAADVDQALLPHALSYLRNEPGKLLIKIVMQFPRFWYLSESPLKSWFLISIQAPLLILALVGAFHTLRTGRQGLPLLLTILYFNLIYAAIVVEGRYSTPVVPYVILLAAVGFQLSFGAIQKLRYIRG